MEVFNDIRLKIEDLKPILSEYLKDEYKNNQNILEDIGLGIIENRKDIINIIERPF